MNDQFWSHVFGQNIYFKLENKFYKHIIDGELLKGATATVPESTVEASTSIDETLATTSDATTKTSEASTDSSKVSSDINKDVNETTIVLKTKGHPIVPLKFLRNLFVSRFRIHSLVDVGLKVAQTAFLCLSYKHMEHMLTLVKTQMSRTWIQQKAVSWAAKARVFVGLFVVRMSSLLLTDKLLIKLLTIFRVYDRDNSWATKYRFSFIPTLDHIAGDMQDFLAKYCVKPALRDSEKASELKLAINESLYDDIESKGVSDYDFKEMFKSSRSKIMEHLERLPESGDGMSADRFNDLLRYRNLTEDENEREKLYEINR